MRSEDMLLVDGRVLPRWQAEQLGLMPVTITRCYRAFTMGGGSSPQLLLMPGDLSKLYPKERYAKPKGESWKGLRQALDENGQPCVAFWPQLL